MKQDMLFGPHYKRCGIFCCCDCINLKYINDKTKSIHRTTIRCIGGDLTVDGTFSNSIIRDINTL